LRQQHTTYHGSHVSVRLQVLDDLALVRGFDSREESRAQTGLELLVRVKFIELATGVRKAWQSTNRRKRTFEKKQQKKLQDFRKGRCFIDKTDFKSFRKWLV